MNQNVLIIHAPIDHSVRMLFVVKETNGLI